MDPAKHGLAVADFTLEDDGVVLAVLVVHETKDTEVAIVGRKIRGGHQLDADALRAPLASHVGAAVA